MPQVKRSLRLGLTRVLKRTTSTVSTSFVKTLIHVQAPTPFITPMPFTLYVLVGFHSLLGALEAPVLFENKGMVASSYVSSLFSVDNSLMDTASYGSGPCIVGQSKLSIVVQQLEQDLSR